MNLSNINPNLPCLRILTSSHNQKRRMSCSTNSKSTHSSSISSSTQSSKSKELNSLPILIQLCIYPDENYACRTMKILFSSRYRYSPNVCDEFGCNVLMYTLRYQRYQLFDFLLNETCLDLNFRAKDREGNTILHYAIIYGKDDTQIMENLIEKFNLFSIDVDERNLLGFTPLLLAMFCGRYDLVLTLLTKTDASPFVRDQIQLKNMLDYLEIDSKHREFIKKIQNNRQSLQSPCLSRESARVRIQLHQTVPPRPETPFHAGQNHPYKNFFEKLLPQAVQDQSGLIRPSILKMFDTESVSSDLLRLIHYINRRYPRISTPRRQENSTDISTTTKLFLQRENSKTSIHRIFNLFDPDLRPKAAQPKVLITQSSQLLTQNGKQPITFKRLGTKLTVLSALSRPQIITKPGALVTMFGTK